MNSEDGPGRPVQRKNGDERRGRKQASSPQPSVVYDLASDDRQRRPRKPGQDGYDSDEDGYRNIGEGERGRPSDILESVRFDDDHLPKHPRAGMRKKSIGDRLRASRASVADELTAAARGLQRWFGVASENQHSNMQQVRFRYEALLDQTRRRSKGKVAAAGGSSVNGTDNASDDDSDDADVVDESLNARPSQQVKLVYNRDEGFQHYRNVFASDIRKLRAAQRPGRLVPERRKTRQFDTFRPTRGRASKLGGAGPRTGSPKKDKRKDTMVMLQLSSLPVFKPYVTYTFIAIQFLVLAIYLALAYDEGQLAPIGLGVKRTACTLDVSSNRPLCPAMFNNTREEGAVQEREQNMWFGPTVDFLIRAGARFPPCMRQDNDILAAKARERQEQCGFVLTNGQTNICDDAFDGYSCCRLADGRAGMTSKTECDSYVGSSWMQTSQGDNMACPEDGSVLIVLRPCCMGMDATCRMLTQEQCAFYDGRWQSSCRVCAETMCLEDMCDFELGGSISADNTLLNVPSDPNQWYRFFTSLFLSAGAIHFVFNAAILLLAGRQIERMAGPVRMFFLIAISGVGANVVSGVFLPYEVQVGPGGAAYGLLGVTLVELFQAWQLVAKPWLELVKLMVIISVCLLIGTLPYVDNFAHVSGFLLGIMAAIVFLPYITFGKWDTARKRLLLFVTAPMLLVVMILAFVFFYTVQNTEFCSWCPYVNCIPYVDGMKCA